VQNTTAPLLNVTRQLYQFQFDTKMGGKCIHKSRQYAPGISCPCENSQPGITPSSVIIHTLRISNISEHIINTNSWVQKRAWHVFRQGTCHWNTSLLPSWQKTWLRWLQEELSLRDSRSLLHKFIQATIPSYFNHDNDSYWESCNLEAGFGSEFSKGPTRPNQHTHLRAKFPVTCRQWGTTTSGIHFLRAIDLQDVKRHGEFF
jgi:hypothetical protein